MALSLTLLTETFNGRHHEITLEKREADTAWMRIQIWNSSLDHRRDDPSKDDVLNFYDVRYDKVRRLVSKAKMNGSYPTITVGLNPATDEKKAFIRVVIVESFAYLADATLDFPMEKDDYEALKKFLAECEFPDIEASVIRNEKAVIQERAGPMSGRGQ
jgi:hypothetical protein